MVSSIWWSILLFSDFVVAQTPLSEVTFQRCSNFQATYSGAYLVDKNLFLQVKFKPVGALEFASRHLWIHTQFGKPGKGTGCCFKPAVGDEDAFAILHLSGIEHQLVRRHGYEKGIAAMEKLSWQALLETSDRFTAAEKVATEAGGRGASKALGGYVGLIPFYGGQGFLHVNMSRVGYKAEYSPKVGNSHTLAGPLLKLRQLASVACSVLQHSGNAVVGVCGEEEKASVKAFFASSPAVPGTCGSALEFAVLNCEDLPVHLPYLLLQWAQQQFRSSLPGSLFRSGRASSEGGGGGGGLGGSIDWAQADGIYFTEADNVLIMGSGNGEDKKALGGGGVGGGVGGGKGGNVEGAEETSVLSSRGGVGELGALRKGGVEELMKGVKDDGRARGERCYLAPTRFEKRSFGSLHDPFGQRVFVGQNVCNEGPVSVSVQGKFSYTNQFER